MGSKTLSTFLKKKYKPEIEDRDGKDCFYCEQPFEHLLMSIIRLNDNDNPQEFDHLNNDTSYNDIANLVLAHKLCNIRKKTNNDWIIKAKKKLLENQRSARMPTSHAGSDKETATETDTNAIFIEIALFELNKWLKEIPKGEDTPRKEFIPRKEFKDLITAKGIKECGHGSQNSFDRILDALTTKEFFYIKEKDKQKKWIIRLRTKDDKDIFDEDK